MQQLHDIQYNLCQILHLHTHTHICRGLVDVENEEQFAMKFTKKEPKVIIVLKT